MVHTDFRRVLLLLSLLAGLLFLAGCAPVKYVMHVDPEFRANSSPRLFPAAPETPRYRYVGQLLGQDNFIADKSQNQDFGTKLFAWLVGLFDTNEEKTTLKRPQTGAVDSLGRVLVTDISNHAVFVFDQTKGELLVWNRAREFTNFVTPIGIAIGPAGQVLVADAELGEVFRLGADGVPIGSFGKGILNRPTGLARDAKLGRIYVSDTHAHDVKVFGDDGVLLETIGQRGEGEGDLNFPTHLAFANDKLYVTDGMNARIQMFDVLGHTIGSLGKRGLYFGNLTRPKGVTVDDAGNIYVVESFYDNLLVFNKDGDFLMPIGGTGKEVGQFYLPAGLWNDSEGRIYVADMFNGRVVIFQYLGVQ